MNSLICISKYVNYIPNILFLKKLTLLGEMEEILKLFNYAPYPIEIKLSPIHIFL